MRRSLLIGFMALVACSSSAGPPANGGLGDAAAADAAFPVEAGAPDAAAEVGPDVGGALGMDAPGDVPIGALDGGADGSPDASPGVLALTCLAPCGSQPEHCGSCVLRPATGCNGPACLPCSFAHATAAPACGPDGACVMAACDRGWADCDQIATNGCETDLGSAAACGQCGKACSPGQICAPDGCRAACAPPATACGSDCVDLTTDPENCGACSHRCTAPAGDCRAGTCQPPVCPKATCNGVCTDLDTDYNNCGACGNACHEGPSRRAAVSCVNGGCQIRCHNGYTFCQGDCVSRANDRSNCGACGHACAATEVCAEGRCAAVASLHLADGLTDPLDLAVDAQDVYWSDSTDGTISRVPRDGGAVVRLADKQAKPARIALDDTHVYWSNTLGAAIMRAPKAGGPAEMVTVAAAPTELAVTGGSVYYLDNSAGTVELRKVPTAGGTSSPIASCPVELAPADPAAPAVTAMVRDGAVLYVVCPRPVRQFAVLRVDTANGDARRSIDGHDLHRGPYLAVSGRYFFHLGGGVSTNLYWYDKDDGTPGAGLSLETSLAPPPPGQMIASGCGLFWWGLGKLVLFNPARGYDAPVIDRGAKAPRRTVVDGNWIFWTEQNAVGKMALP